MNYQDKKTTAPETGTGSDEGKQHHRYDGRSRRPLIFSMMQEIIEDFPEIDDEELDDTLLEEVKNKPKRLRELVVYFREREADKMRPKAEVPALTLEELEAHTKEVAVRKYTRRQGIKKQAVKMTVYELTMKKFGERTGGETIALGEEIRKEGNDKAAFGELVIKLGQSVGFTEKVNTLNEDQVDRIGLTEEAFSKFMA